MAFFPRAVRMAGVIFVCWTVFGILLGQQIYALRAGNGPLSTWRHALAFELNYCYVWALATPAILRLGRTFLLRRPGLWRSLAIHVGASVTFALLVQSVHILALRSYPGWFPRTPLSTLPRSLMSTVDYGAILYWVVLLVGHSLEYLRRYDVAQLRQAELQEQLAEAHLQALRMQMHPHFLFNALNSISELIHEDKAAADRMITRLSELLRIYLRSSEAQEISLGQEVEFLERYLEIQKIRFEERLTVRIRLGEQTVNASVPSLILQPLVENAIVHGIADREQNGTIEIAAAVRGSSLELLVADNGSGLEERVRTPLAEGTGIRNTRRRLERIYGKHHDFSLEARVGEGLRALIRIPLKNPAMGAAHA